eukprot:GHVS01031600.1.p1 GENE.GHVS01031600.1~~GHVS01031600.1.p1  ORF type:complete len:396 (+),score=68.88 GHVS01031600.1:216-1403(+)
MHRVCCCKMMPSSGSDGSPIYRRRGSVSSPCPDTVPANITSSNSFLSPPLPSLPPPRLLASSKCSSTVSVSDSLGGIVSGPQFVEQADVFLFDCDGVLWHGDKLIERVIETLEQLQAAGKQLYFVTNNSSKSRQGYLAKFQRLGLGDVVKDPSQIICSAHAVAAYLVEKGFKETGKKVYVVGEAGLSEELTLAGIPCIGGQEDSSKVVGSGGLQVDSSVGCVVVGLDREFNYYKLQYAQLCINELNADFVATNTDQLGHFTESQACAGSGGMVGAVEGCTGVSPTVIGKPNSYMIDILRQRLATSGSSTRGSIEEGECSWRRVKRSRMVMVGDRLDTDIMFGVNADIGTVLTLSGIVDLPELKAQASRALLGDEGGTREMTILPDFFADTIADFV